MYLHTFLIVLFVCTPVSVTPFVPVCQGGSRRERFGASNIYRKQFKLHAEQKGTAQDLRREAERLLKRAKELRETIPNEKVSTSTEAIATKTPEVSPWGVDASDAPGIEYRLYCDIGREEGSWMDPRWGAGGRRIEFTLDVRFLMKGGDGALADKAVQESMVKDNFGGRSSPVFVLQCASKARLRNGFESMDCHGGEYRIDAGKNGFNTVRFFVTVDGTSEEGSSYGDVSIPKGCLYLSLPCFGNSVCNLSTKEGIVSVRQVGWNPGWRREESRIVGVFRAVPIESARKRDGF